MCLAISGEVIDVKDNKALTEVKGIKMWVNIDLIDNCKKGEYILIHGGFAIQKIDMNYHSFLKDTIDEVYYDFGEVHRG
ncbi:HypC/HybG/HupF family hydrogenase formation chaperone [Clostridium sp.]|uniref:HypC/HybG/HupF family hydrogenase formation chaperone n=1 Tax=Clostridium sp. TaxID=1506 RepID=UPI002FCC1B39